MEFIEDYKYIYFNNGDIFSKSLKRNIKISNSSNGYKQVKLFGKTSRLHRVIYEKFIGVIPSESKIHHKNGLRSDNRIENLKLIKFGGKKDTSFLRFLNSGKLFF